MRGKAAARGRWFPGTWFAVTSGYPPGRATGTYSGGAGTIPICLLQFVRSMPTPHTCFLDQSTAADVFILPVWPLL